MSRGTTLVLWVVLHAACEGCGRDNASIPPPRDTTPPASIGDLRATHTIGETVLLEWTAPGDDGKEGQASRYDVRYSASPITSEAEWDSATTTPPPPLPQPAGRLESFGFSGVEVGKWNFAIAAIDDAENRSPLSEVVQLTVVDTIPPARITDLSLVFSTPTSVRLRWDAPGDDRRLGTALRYEMRYGLDSLTDESWASAQLVPDLPTPRVAGTPETLLVGSLDVRTRYYFGLKAVDEVANWSPLSRVLQCTTDDPALRQLTNASHEFGASEPHWSPDGESILFQWDKHEQFYSQLFQLRLDRRSPAQFTFDPLEARNPKWSPNGDRVAFKNFYEEHGVPSQEVRVMAASAGSSSRRLVGGGIWISGLTWSPNGSEIIYSTQNVPGTPTEAAIFRIDVSSGARETLFSEAAHVVSVDWSPDGTTIAFGLSRTGTFDIWLYDLVNRSLRQLTTDSSNEGRPVWSPDGTQIAYTSDKDGEYDLWVMDRDGSNPRQLLDAPYAQAPGDWSPDGAMIAFTSWSLPWQVWVLDLTAARPAGPIPELAPGQADDRDPEVGGSLIRVFPPWSWSPEFDPSAGVASRSDRAP